MTSDNRKSSLDNFLTTCISLTLIVLSMILFFYLCRLNIFEIKNLLIIGLILILVYVIVILFLLRRNVGIILKLIFYVISIFMIFGYSTVINGISSTIDFMQNLTSSSVVKQKYSVIVLKNSEYSDVLQLNGKRIGISSVNPNKNKANDAFIKETNLKYDIIYENITDLFMDLSANNIDAIIADNALLSLIRDEEDLLLEEIREIYSFSIDIYKFTNNKDINMGKDPFMFYISGSDAPSGIMSDTDRSDVNIIAVINPSTHKVLLVNIPRDYYVKLHGTEGPNDKLTHAGMYGVNMSIATLEDLLDIKIDYYAKVGFTTLVNSVDVLGGIEINSPVDFTNKYNKKVCKIKKGVQYVDGTCALVFARERKTMPKGDYSRGLNQQQVISAMIGKLTNPSIIMKYDDILKAIDGSFETNMTYNEMTTLIKSQMSSLSDWKVETVAVDGDEAHLTTYSMGDQVLYVTIPSEEDLKKAKEEINRVLKGK